MFYGIPPERNAQFYQALKVISEIYPGQFYAADMNIVLSRNLSFSKDRKFMGSFASLAENEQEKSLLWRLHVLCWAATHALHFEGDFVECGVLKGFSSSVICKYLEFAKVPRQFYLYDTFAGLPEETSTELERQNYQGYKDYDSDELYIHVLNTFSEYPNVRIVKGIVPHSFKQAQPEKIAYLHIDMNSKQAEILALEHLFSKVSPGGVIVLDDFGWQVHKDQMEAEYEFMKERGYSVLELPTGQGIVLKREN